MAVKYNPYRPNNMVNSGMFVGRIDEIDILERCLVQAKNGNPQHFLVMGERGIGKSSLLFYFEMIATGKSFARYKGKFLVVSVDIGDCYSEIGIIKQIGRGLKQSLNEHQGTIEAAKELWAWLLNWEILGVKYHKDEGDIDPSQITDELVNQFVSFIQKTEGVLDGVVVLIDESDRPSAEAGLGQFLKLFTERLTRRGCNNVLLGLAGLPGVLAKLRESHESSPRLFQTIPLAPLEFEERKSVVNLGLDEANKKNSVVTTITDDALDFLADLSEGYPHFVQQFAYSAFEEDSDDIIDDDDVANGAFKEGGALSQLGDKFFNEMYHARIGSEDYRRVLDAMADHGDQWVSRQVIIKECGVSEANVGNALGTLKVKNIIIQDDTRRGFYRLPTNSFAAWINANLAARAKSDATGKTIR